MYVLNSDEAIIFDGTLKYNGEKVLFTLTSKRMIFEKTVGFFKKSLEIVDEIPLENIILYKNKVQIKQKRSKLKIQTIDKRIILFCNNFSDATKIKEKLITARTGLTIVERASNNIKNKVETGGKLVAIGALVTGVIVGGIKNSKTIAKNSKVIYKTVKETGKSIIQIFIHK